MTNGQRLNLNLATHPARNRRLFLLLMGLVAGLLAVLLIVGGSQVIRYGFRSRTVRANLAQVQQKISAADTEGKEYERQISQAERDHQRRIDTLNQLIYRKSFSWVGLLGSLEELLPGPCYIVSLKPAFHEDAVMDLRFKVASPDYDSWQILVGRIYELGFTDLRMESETRGTDGFIIFDMAVTYERDI
jgi:Tfp pilus assembly protein PilN